MPEVLSVNEFKCPLSSVGLPGPHQCTSRQYVEVDAARVWENTQLADKTLSNTEYLFGIRYGIGRDIIKSELGIS